MDMVGAAMAEGRHAFDEEHPLGVRVLAPELVAEALQRGYQPLRIVAGRRQQEDVDDRLGVEPGHRGAADMLDAQPGQRQRRADGFGFGGEVLWPGGVGRQHLDAVVVGVAPALAVEAGRLG